uniref:Fibroblast growth factor n=1 Tax=Canis lupus familiaris TaxID=9615 RepID=A0A8C0TPV9_CANLF
MYNSPLSISLQGFRDISNVLHPSSSWYFPLYLRSCANRYPAMKAGGRLLASQCVTDECFFFERLESKTYNTYWPRKCSSWYVALERTGQCKLGPKTGPGQNAIPFLPMSAKS